MVRLDADKLVGTNCVRKFQFLVVRLDDDAIVSSAISKLFQFLVVRLDVIYVSVKQSYYLISIPCGAIR